LRQFQVIEIPFQKEPVKFPFKIEWIKEWILTGLIFVCANSRLAHSLQSLLADPDGPDDSKGVRNARSEYAGPAKRRFSGRL
jgi:hypothetical protein